MIKQGFAKKLLSMAVSAVMGVQCIGGISMAAEEKIEQDNYPTIVYSTTYRTPETGKSLWWREGMVTGNGENGAIIAGAPLDDSIIYQHIMFNRPSNDLRETPDIRSWLEPVRQDLINFKAPTSQWGSWSMQYDYSFHPGHQLRIKPAKTKGSIYGYKRYTNYETAEVGVEYYDDYGKWERKTFASREDNVVITHISSSSNGEKVSMRFSIDDLEDMNYESPIDTATKFKRIAASDGSYIGQVVKYPSFERSELKNGGFAGVTYIINIGGSKSRVDAGAITDSMAAGGTRNYMVDVSEADEIFLVTKSGRDKDMCEYGEFAGKTDFALIDSLLADIKEVINNKKYYENGKLSYEALLAPHAKLHGDEFNKVRFSLGGGDDRSLSNEELISKQRSDKSKLNAAMAERAFYAGRYGAVCSSGYAAPRLGGMWTGAWNCAWQADWTTDANVNLQMAGMNIGNIGVGIEGYISFILRIVDDWELSAKNIYDMHDAIMAPPRTDGDKGGVVHFSQDYPFNYWNAGASWLLLPIYEYWLCRGEQQIPIPEDLDIYALKSVLSPNDEDYSDKEIEELFAKGYLSLEKDILLPLLTKQANFWQQLVDPRYYEDENGTTHYDANKTQLSEGERYLILPSYSPENTPKGRYTNQLTINTTMDISAAKDGLSMAIEIANATGNTENIEKWENLREKLPAYKYDSTGALREWAVNEYTENHAHRHISHTYSAWPAHESRNDAQLQEGIATAITLRKSNAGDKKSGHGWLHMGLVDARLKNGAGVKDALLTLIGGTTYYTSMMTNHNVTGDSAYCTDTLNTVPAIMLEALVYSNSGEIEILPALVEEWNNGEVSGVRARTRAEVSLLSWDIKNKTADVTVTSTRDGNRIKLRCGELWKNAVSEGKELEVLSDDMGKYVLLSLDNGESMSVSFELEDERDGIEILINGEKAENEITLNEGTAVNIEARSLRSAYAKCTLSSNSMGIAMVRNGVLYANASGSAVITAQLGSMKKSITVKVEGGEKIHRVYPLSVKGSEGYDRNWIPDNAFDGDVKTAYASKDNSGAKYLQAELEAAVPVSDVFVIGRYSEGDGEGKYAVRINKAKIYASNSPMNGNVSLGTLVGEVSGVTATSDFIPSRVKIDTKGESYRYYMIYFDLVNNGSATSLAASEIAFYAGNTGRETEAVINFAENDECIETKTVTELLTGNSMKDAFSLRSGNVIPLGDYLYRIISADYSGDVLSENSSDNIVTVKVERIYKIGEKKENLLENGDFEDKDAVNPLDYWKTASNNKTLREVTTFAPNNGGNASRGVAGYFSGGYTLEREDGSTFLHVAGNKRANPDGNNYNDNSYSSTQSGCDQYRTMVPIVYWNGARKGKSYYITFDIKADSIHSDKSKPNYVYFGAYKNALYNDNSGYGINFRTRTDAAAENNISEGRYTIEPDVWYTVSGVIDVTEDGYFGFEMSWTNDWSGISLDNFGAYEIDTNEFKVLNLTDTELSYESSVPARLYYSDYENGQLTKVKGVLLEEGKHTVSFEKNHHKVMIWAENSIRPLWETMC